MKCSYLEQQHGLLTRGWMKPSFVTLENNQYVCVNATAGIMTHQATLSFPSLVSLGRESALILWSLTLARLYFFHPEKPPTNVYRLSLLLFCKPWRRPCEKIALDQQFLSHSRLSSSDDHVTFKVTSIFSSLTLAVNFKQVALTWARMHGVASTWLAHCV